MNNLRQIAGGSGLNQIYFLSTYSVQCQFGCAMLKIVGPKMQAFCLRINMLKGNRCILRLRGAPFRQKLSMILENKVVQKLKLDKNVVYKKWSPRLIFLND